MKIVGISDIHNRQKQVGLPEGDVLVCAGDLTGAGNIWEVADFAQWLAEQKFKHKLVIAGNHDWAFEDRPDEARELMKEAGAIYLENSEVIIDGVKFWGSPWTPRFFDWAFNADPDKLKECWDAIPADTDVLITHGPPYGILDINREGQHCGCSLLLDAVTRVNPQLHLFGHIHEGSGYMHGGQTHFMNVSVVNRSYYVVNPPREHSLLGAKIPVSCT